MEEMNYNNSQSNDNNENTFNNQQDNIQNYNYQPQDNNQNYYNQQNNYNLDEDKFKKITFNKLSKFLFGISILLGIAGIMIAPLLFFAGLSFVAAIVLFIVDKYEKKFVKKENRIDINEKLNNISQRKTDVEYQQQKLYQKMEKTKTYSKISIIFGATISTTVGILMALLGLRLLKNPYNVPVPPEYESVKNKNIKGIAISCVALVVKVMIYIFINRHHF